MNGKELTDIDAIRYRLEAQDALTEVFVGADRRDWEAVEAALGEQVRIDYTSLNGGEPAVLGRQELTAAWRGTLGGFESTQHLLGSFLFDEVSTDRARLRFYAQATHVLHIGHGEPTWTVAGHYEATLSRTEGRWRVVELTLHTDWAAGNEALVAAETERGGS